MTIQIVQQLVPSSVTVAPTLAGVNSCEWVTIHETANRAPGADAQAHANLQTRGNARASWHYQVDDTRVIQSFPDRTRCAHAGNREGNRVSIGIEMCVNVDGDYLATVKNTARLVAVLMLRHGIPIDRVVQHNHWSGKNCPTILRAGTAGITWPAFLALVRAEYVRATTPTPIKTTKTEPSEEDTAMQIITAPGRGQALINTSAIPAYVPLATPAETQAAGKLAWHRSADLVQLTDAEFDAVATFLKRGA